MTPKKCQRAGCGKMIGHAKLTVRTFTQARPGRARQLRHSVTTTPVEFCSRACKLGDKGKAMAHRAAFEKNLRAEQEQRKQRLSGAIAMLDEQLAVDDDPADEQAPRLRRGLQARLERMQASLAKVEDGVVVNDHAGVVGDAQPETGDLL